MLSSGPTPESFHTFQKGHIDAEYAGPKVKQVEYLDKAHKLISTHLARWSAVMNNKELRDGGLAGMHDFIARIRKDKMPEPPKEEHFLRVDGVIYRIAEVGKHPWGPEWKLGMKSATS